jgi:prepilin-type N-terminal cleavage/methylation domain-containing protein
MPRHDGRRRAGFTLVEVLVALALAGVVLLGARTLLEHLADETHGVTQRAASADAIANGERLLRTLAGRLEVGTAESGPFSGTSEAAHFTSWCEVPQGWLERCDVTIALEQLAGEFALVARLDDAPPLVLRRGFASGALRYLNSAAQGGQWFRSWGTGITAPLALGVILDRDTLIIRIGERG